MTSKSTYLVLALPSSSLGDKACPVLETLSASVRGDWIPCSLMQLSCTGLRLAAYVGHGLVITSWLTLLSTEWVNGAMPAASSATDIGLHRTSTCRGPSRSVPAIYDKGFGLRGSWSATLSVACETPLCFIALVNCSDAFTRLSSSAFLPSEPFAGACWAAESRLCPSASCVADCASLASLSGTFTVPGLAILVYELEQVSGCSAW